MNAYRDSAAPPLEPVAIAPHGLVRKSGVRCRCTPPWRIWCWWYDVSPGDSWSCIHGGGWTRMSSLGTVRFYDFWESTPRQGKASDDE